MSRLYTRWDAEKRAVAWNEGRWPNFALWFGPELWGFYVYFGHVFGFALRFSWTRWATIERPVDPRPWL